MILKSSAMMTAMTMKATMTKTNLLQILCGLWIFTDFGMTLASIFTLLAISVDRYWSVHWSNHYRTHNTPRKARVIIAVIW